MPESLVGVGLLLLGGVVSFMTARYWQLQSGAIKEAERLATEHAKLTARVTELELAHALLKQRMDLEKQCRGKH